MNEVGGAAQQARPDGSRSANLRYPAAAEHPVPEHREDAAADAERRGTEPAKAAAFRGERGERRSPFARDRARVLHSAALRRLAGKTQVVGPGEGDDVPRTRLTHSLEVAQIGRGIGEELGCDPDIVDTAGLAHDIGHPPFGHNGERALDEITADCGGFEGNAQTFRILVRLEPKVLGPDGESLGLNLTRATLDAVSKYPWPRRDATPKYGVYTEDLAAFEWMRAVAPEPRRRCLEAQVMDWADDVAYSVHDVEDGVGSGLISLRALVAPAAVAEVAEVAAQWYGTDTAAVTAAAARLVDLAAVRALVDHDFDGTVGAQVALKAMTSELVGRFASAVVGPTRAANDGEPVRRYQADLVIPPEAAAEVALLKATAARYVMNADDHLRGQSRQREQIAELFDALGRGAPGTLDPAFAQLFRAAPDDRARQRVLVDQVVALTDAQAVDRHTRLAAR